MRYVDIEMLMPPVGWTDRADAASRAIADGANPNDHGQVWRDLKDSLAQLLHEKCWFCEVPVERSDNAVDHFRPKGRVSDATRQHLGYRWLAFRKINFRYACTFCNSRRKDVLHGTAGGKADRFPLLDEDTRLYEDGPLEQESPVLLDPCILSDCQLLGCQIEDGRPCATSLNPVDKLRAEESIVIYHLHHEPTCKRRHSTAVKFLSDIEDGKRQFTLSSQDPSREPDFKLVAKRLYRAIGRSSPFSGDMRFLMRGERSDNHPWIQELLEA